MSLASVTKKIDGATFYCSQLPPFKRSKFLARLFFNLAPILPKLGALQAALPTAKDGETSDPGALLKDDPEKVFGLLQAILEANESDNLLNFIEHTVKFARKDGNQITNLDIDFEDENLPELGMSTIFKVFMMVLEVNGGEVFKKLGNLNAVKNLKGLEGLM